MGAWLAGVAATGVFTSILFAHVPALGEAALTGFCAGFVWSMLTGRASRYGR